jgi:hypothetical protein
MECDPNVSESGTGYRLFPPGTQFTVPDPPRPKINLAAPTLCPVFRSILGLLSKGWSQPLCPRQVGFATLGVSPGIASLRDADSQRVEYLR